MKAVLEFSLPDDKDEFKLACDRFEWWQAMYCLDRELRNHIKYGNGSDWMSESDRAAWTRGLEHARELLHGQLQDKGISLEVVS